MISIVILLCKYYYLHDGKFSTSQQHNIKFSTSLYLTLKKFQAKSKKLNKFYKHKFECEKYVFPPFLFGGIFLLIIW